MRVLLDECLVPRYASLFGRHACCSVRDMGWLGRTNGELLRAAAAEFDALVSFDRHLPHQRNLGAIDLVVVIIRESRNDPDRAAETIGLVESLLDTQPGFGAHWVDLD